MAFAHRAADASSTPDRRARIAIFTGNYNHIVDGVSCTLNHAVRHLEATGHEVLVFAPTIERPAVEHVGTLVAVPSFAAPGRPEYRVSYALPRAARQRLRDFAPDIIHIATPDFLGLFGLIMAWRLRIPAVSSFHTHFASYLKYYHLGLFEPVLWTYLRLFYARCQQVYVRSESMRAVLSEKSLKTDLRIWGGGVDLEAFHPKHRSQGWRESQGLGAGDVVVTFVSRLVREKGLDTLVALIRELEARGVAHRSLVVGDGPERASLERQLPSTRFFGHASRGQLAAAYASSDIFVFTSETETFGNVTLEAMASGLPTVCVNATGSRSLVRHGETGLLAAAQEMPEAVSRLITDAGLRRTLGSAARQCAETFSWQSAMAPLIAHYREILAPSCENDATGKG